MSRLIKVYTADDETPRCGRCEHFIDAYDCSRYCGAERAWRGYKRIEDAEEDNE